MKKYIDFDGVIMDTYLPLFQDYLEKRKEGIYVDDTIHVINKNWQEVLTNSVVINDAIRVIKELNIDNTAILTRIHSLENEGVAKINFLRSNGVRCNIILVPYQVKKTDIVSAKNNILVDDAIFNLNEWEMAGGLPIFFDTYQNNIDGWGVENKKYPKTRTLEILKKYE